MDPGREGKKEKAIELKRREKTAVCSRKAGWFSLCLCLLKVNHPLPQCMALESQLVPCQHGVCRCVSTHEGRSSSSSVICVQFLVCTQLYLVSASRRQKRGLNHAKDTGTANKELCTQHHMQCGYTGNRSMGINKFVITGKQQCCTSTNTLYFTVVVIAAIYVWGEVKGI